MSPRIKKIIKWVLWRIPLVVVVVMALMIGTLKLVERYPDPLRQGFEEYMTKTTGGRATIGTLDKITFFPKFQLEANNITIHDSANAAIILLEAKHIEISAPFWSMFVGGDRLDYLSVQNFRANEDVLTPKAIEIEKINIVEREGPDQYGSFLIAAGRYDGQKMNFEAELEKLKKGYRFSDVVPFSWAVGKTSLSANLVKGFSKVEMKNAVFSHHNQTGVSQDYLLVDGEKYNKDTAFQCMLDHGDSVKCKQFVRGQE